MKDPVEFTSRGLLRRLVELKRWQYMPVSRKEFLILVNEAERRNLPLSEDILILANRKGNE